MHPICKSSINKTSTYIPQIQDKEKAEKTKPIGPQSFIAFSFKESIHII